MRKIVQTLRSVYVKMLVILVLTLVAFGVWFTNDQLNTIQTEVEQQIDQQGSSLAKTGAQAIQAIAENDIKAGIISAKTLYNRDYTVLSKDEATNVTKYKSQYDDYTDINWLPVEDALLMSDEVAYAIAAAFSEDPKLNGYVPSHNTVFKARSKRIFNDVVGAKVAMTLQPIKQIYKRDTGETMWDYSYPIYINGQHWGGFRVALFTTKIDEKVAAAKKNAINQMIYIGVVVVAVLLIITFLLVGRPLKKCVKYLKEAQNSVTGETDLTKQLKIKSKDEFGELAATVNTFVSKIKETVSLVAKSNASVRSAISELSQDAQGIAVASESIAQAVDKMDENQQVEVSVTSKTLGVANRFATAINQIAAGSEQQAASVLETTSSINILGDTINEVTDQVRDVYETTTSVSKVVLDGEKAVNSTISGMEKIKGTVFDVSHKIEELGGNTLKVGEIIKVIKNIANQTNLLALNAAIEAARAGKQGKGFAVVAAEVRQLAEKSETATREISELLNTIQKETEITVAAMEICTGDVGEGVVLANNAGKAFDNISLMVSRAREQVQLISNSVLDISASSREVLPAMQNISEITQKNSVSTGDLASNTDEIMAAIEQISTLASTSANLTHSIVGAVEESTMSSQNIARFVESLANMLAEQDALVNKFKI